MHYLLMVLPPVHGSSRVAFQGFWHIANKNLSYLPLNERNKAQHITFENVSPE
jgi:hypothetical protein